MLSALNRTNHGVGSGASDFGGYDSYVKEKLQSDEDTMSYNAGYDVSYFGYHYDTGCIDFPESRWQEMFEKRVK